MFHASFKDIQTRKYFRFLSKRDGHRTLQFSFIFSEQKSKCIHCLLYSSACFSEIHFYFTKNWDIQSGKANYEWNNKLSQIREIDVFFSKFFAQLAKCLISFALKTVENKKQNWWFYIIEINQFRCFLASTVIKAWN